MTIYRSGRFVQENGKNTGFESVNLAKKYTRSKYAGEGTVKVVDSLPKLKDEKDNS